MEDEPSTSTATKSLPPLWRDPVILLVAVAVIGAGTFLAVTLGDSYRRESVAATPSVAPPPALTPEPSDPEAVALLQQIEAAMNQLSTLQTVEVIRDDSDGMSTTTIQYAAPDKVMLTAASGAQSIGIGPRQWAHEAGETLWSTWERVEPFRFPNFDDSRKAVDVQREAGASLDGAPALVVTYAELSLGKRFDFKVYADPDTLLIRRFTMDGPGHHMVSDYMDTAPAIVITPPPANLIAPTPTTNP